MRPKTLKTHLKTAALAVTVLLLGAVIGFSQQQINLTAGPAAVALPDGSTVPMWGYTCGAAVATNTVPVATCAPLNPAAAVTGASVTLNGTTTTLPLWSPVIITVPTGQTLQINLTNSLSFPYLSTTPTAQIPTSLVIVGQLGGGLGAITPLSAPGNFTTSPDHTTLS